MEIKLAHLNVISGTMWRVNVFLKTNVCLSSVFHVIGKRVRMSSSKLAQTESNISRDVKQITVNVTRVGQMTESVATSLGQHG